MFEKDYQKFEGVEFRAEFLSRLYEGANLAEACAQMKVNPAALGVFMKDNQEFDSDIRTALAFRVELMVDKLENIQDIEENPMMAGVISKNIQWIASRRSRKIYGEKLDVQHSVVIDICAAMEMAKARTLEHIDDNPLKQLNSSTDNISVSLPILDAEEVEVDPLSA